MAQHSLLTSSEHRGHPSAFGRDARVTHGEDASVNRLKPAGSDTAVDRGLAEPSKDELKPRDDSVLCGRELRDPPLLRPSVRSPSVFGADLTFGGHGCTLVG